ncbi:hypothetical protein PQE70_gp019 [Bacillus phage vB_BanS_Nate]|uniref:Uncharacterized protein n=1 Tax=Bacillus phage vB_BanS_Nate TaxID=2894788 RepID=A0AAE8YUK8_9CAUD|nr:hypothetical protein PQE70_gp019 [Bacillus phage vB_BanS_Nate]UGO50872.1 hypothetical protein NATE_19 [Bacillus phage vB_BanS_Nate]
MAKMTVREAVDYAIKATGKDYTEELQNKIVNFLSKLPRHPQEISHDTNRVDVTLRDYDYGWYITVLVMNDKGKMLVKVVDGDNLDPNPQRVKSNTEALQVMKELSEVKWASDIDEYWNMSDDNKYWRRMNDINMNALDQTRRLKNKLA